MRNSIFSIFVVVVQLLLASLLIAVGFYAEENIYAPAAVDGYFYIRFLVPGICFVIGAIFDLAYSKFEKKVYLAVYCSLLIFAVANTFCLSVFALNHFPITWVSEIINCILISLATSVVCGLFSFVYVVTRGRAGKVLVGLNDEQEK